LLVDKYSRYEGNLDSWGRSSLPVVIEFSHAADGVP
jgi:hypothetical protein